MESQHNGIHSHAVKAGQEGIGFLVKQTSRAFSAHLSETVVQYGLDTSQYTVLRHIVREIGATPDGVPLAGLSRKLNIPAKSLAESSQRLERDGWLSIKPSASGDVLLVPSRRAYSVVPVLVDASRWMLERALNGFSHDEIDVLSEQLKRILLNMGAPFGDDEGPL